MSQDDSETTLILVYDVESTDQAQSIQSAMDVAYDNGYGLISYPLLDPASDTRQLIDSKHESKQPVVDDANHSDLVLSNIPFNYTGNTPSATFSSVYGKISPWISFEHSQNGTESKSSKETASLHSSYEHLLQHEVDWAAHLGIFCLFLPTPKVSADRQTQMDISVNYASAILSTFDSREQMIGIIPIPFTRDGWEVWSSLSILLRKLKNVRPALIIEKDVPSDALIEQWFAEGVQIFLLSADVFVTNKKGFPVLSRAHQKMLLRFVRWIDSTIVIKGEPSKPKQHAQYLQHLKSACKPFSEPEVEEKNYWDVLQTPLQPLSTNLEYSTYETFESDPVKYIGYEKAVIQALIDFDKNSVKNQQLKDSNKGFVVMVLGAGRGPLVTAAMNASRTTGVKIRLYAIEKNPFAVVILKDKNKREWNNTVTIVEQDMREWKYTEKAHIIISELLGSFADNELSPECLDGGQRVLRADGISIPSSYTSYMCPITNNSVHSRLKAMPHDFEIPYVVHLMRHCRLSEIQKCWSFEHPNRDKIMENNAHNARYCKLSFKIEIAGGDNAEDATEQEENTSVVHGFAGYFETVLYKDVNLSIHPRTFSKDMFSWFPYYFPLMQPVKVKNGDVVTVHLWRKTDKTCVWYEWCVTEPVLSQIHNPCHRSYSVNLH